MMTSFLNFRPNLDDYMFKVFSWHCKCLHVYYSSIMLCPPPCLLFIYYAISTLLYACETWSLYSRDIKRLESFQQRKLRQLLNTRWEMRLSNNEILKRARLPSVEATILQHRLRWAGYVVRMGPSRLPRIMLYGELNEGTRPHGRPKLWYKDQLKCSLKQAGINIQSWEHLANDRAAWRRKIRDGVESFETARKQQDEDRQKRRHEKQNQPHSPPLYQGWAKFLDGGPH